MRRAPYLGGRSGIRIRIQVDLPDHVCGATRLHERFGRTLLRLSLKSWKERIAVLRKAADLIEQRVYDIAEK